MALATLTSKGQVTIPKKIRQALQLHDGDKIEITVTGRGEAVLRPVSKSVDDMYCRLHRPGREPVSVERMNDAVRERMRARAT